MKWTIAIVMLAACGGGDGGGVAVDDLPKALAHAVCAKLDECCTTMEFMDETLGADNVMECEALYTAFGGFLATQIKDSVAKGRVVYHGDRVQECFDEYASETCVEYQQDDAECTTPFEPKVADDGECGADFDCTSGFCNGDSIDFETMMITYGVCQVAPTAGMACVDFECAEGFYCDASMCMAPQADGAECNVDDECQSNSCNEGTSGPSTCGPIMTCDGT